MAEKADAGTRVEIRRVMLAAGERAPHVPPDTQRVPLEMRVSGVLAHDASIGDEVTIVTPIGRRITGTLAAIAPAYPHRFGPPNRELLPIGAELRELLRTKPA